MDAYLVDLNATKAYMSVYKDSSYEAAQTSSHALLRNPKIKDLISKKLTESEEMRSVTRERILREYKSIGFSNIYDFINVSDDHISLKYGGHIDEDKQKVVKEIEVTKTYKDDEFMEMKAKLKLHDKMKALGVLSEYVELIEKKDSAPAKIEFVLKHDNGKSDV
ncbi:terminase small subunit [Kangiella sp.]|uniref:terminase small subunit n=1 Tax=Kangiella sp. TaxID=1920245 RepID=UPI003A8D9541